MRANIPTENDYDSTLPVVDEQSPEEKISNEERQLTKIGNSEEWNLIRKYIDLRVEQYKVNLFGEELKDSDTAIIGQRFLAARSVIGEFERLKEEIDRVTKSVNEVDKDAKEGV